MNNLKFNSSLLRAEKLMLSKKYNEALTEYQTIIKKDSKNFLANVNSAIIYYLLGKTEFAIKHFQMVEEKIHNNAEITIKYCDALIKIEKYDHAIEVAKRALVTNENNVVLISTIAGALSKKENHIEALSYAIQAIQSDPRSSRAFLQLGNILFDLKRYKDAAIAFETCIELNPSDATARFNLASCYSSLNFHEKAIEQYNHCLNTPDLTDESIKQIKFFLSHIYLKKGELKKGWDLHEYGFINNTNTSRHPYRKFKVKQWQGESLRGKKLLVWKEQGLGDMFMFMSCFPSLLELCDDIFIECDYRAVPLLKRAFPSCTVRPESYGNDFTTLHNDYDFHLPMGSLMKHFRSDIQDFNYSKPYLKPNLDMKHVFSNRLQGNNERLKVGICWRSGITSTTRNSNYLPLAEFLPVLSIPDATFVNLQYGDCQKELTTLATDFGILINNWPDIDQKNNLDAVASLISELDIVISAGTAVAQITAALGTNLILFAPSNSWTFLGQDEYPWYPNIKTFKFNNDAEKLLIPDLIHQYLLENSKQIKCGKLP